MPELINPELIISDTSCLILLSKIDQLHLLRGLYQKIIITPTIQREFGVEVPEWIEVVAPKDKALIKTLGKFVDEGEASAFALAFEIGNCVLILDDRKARKLAKSLGFKLSGTLAILLEAKERGLLKSIRPVLDDLIRNDFRISQTLVSGILKQAGEN
jgi:predicted nucleic acid-binding protein